MDWSHTKFGIFFGDKDFCDRLLVFKQESLEDIHPSTSSTGVRGLGHKKRKRDNNGTASDDDGVGSASDDDGGSLTPATVFSVRVSSVVLGIGSEYFYKLFKRTKEKEVTIKIQQSEGESMKALIKFMYDDSTLSWTNADEVLQIMMLSDRFCVPQCVNKCIVMLCNNPMTVDYALEYLRLPSHLKADLQLLTDAAKKFLQIYFRHIIGLEEEVLKLPLFAVEELLSSNELCLDYEDSLFDLVLKWVEINCPENKRKETIQNHLVRHIRFPYMSENKLKMVMKSKFLDQVYAHQVVMESLLFKSGIGNPVSILRKEQFVQRVYKYKSLKVFECKTPRKEINVFMELQRDDCTKLFSTGHIYSEVFKFDGFEFVLRAESIQNSQTMAHIFEIGVSMLSSTPTQFVVDVKFSTRSKPSFDYECHHSFPNIFSSEQMFVGTTNLLKLLEIPLLGFIVDISLKIFYILSRIKGCQPSLDVS